MSDEGLMLIRQMQQEMRQLRDEVVRMRCEMAQQRMRSTWMDMKEACEYLHISVSTMKNRMAEGEFAFAVKKGRKWMFQWEDIRKYASNVI